MLEDGRLVLKLKHGDAEALRLIYEKHKDDLLTIATSLLHDSASAEDILHDVFVSFAKNIGRFRPYGSLRNYLITAVINRVRDRFRAKMYHVVGLDSTSAISADTKTPEKTIIDDENFRILSESLAKLPMNQQEVITMHLHGAMKFRQIARIQDVSVNTVIARYRYGISKLRSLLRPEIIQ